MPWAILRRQPLQILLNTHSPDDWQNMLGLSFADKPGKADSHEIETYNTLDMLSGGGKVVST